jgi:hypothetical protein
MGWPVAGAVTRAVIAVAGGAAVIRLGASLDHICMAASLGMMSFGLLSPTAPARGVLLPAIRLRSASGKYLLEMSLSENPGYFVSISRCNIKKDSRITGR